MGARRGRVIVMLSGGGLGMTRPLVSHRGSYLPTRGLPLDTTPLGRELLTRRLPRPVSARPAGD